MSWKSFHQASACWRLGRVSILLALFAALYLAGCGGSGGDGDGGTGGSADSVRVSGLLLNEIGKPVSGVSVSSPQSGASVLSGVDGRFTLDLPRVDPRLRVARSDSTEYLLRVPLSSGTGPEFDLEAPLFLPDEQTALAGTVAAGAQPVEVIFEDPSLPGLRLVLPATTVVTYPTAVPQTLGLQPMAAERLPVPLPAGQALPIAVSVEPAGVTFSIAARLSLPNAEGLAPGEVVDVWRLDPATADWVDFGDLTVSVDGASLEGAQLARGGIYAVTSRIDLPTTTLEGRVRGVSQQSVDGYSVVGPGAQRVLTDAAGFFRLQDVPVYPDEHVRLRICAPVRFRHEFLTTPAEPVVVDGVTDFGDIAVSALLRTPSPPSLTFSPAPGAEDVPETARIVVTFGRRMVVDTTGVQLVRGLSREQRGVDGSLSMRVVGEQTVLEFVPERALRNGTFYTVFVPKTSRDVDGNVVRDDDTSARFTVRAEAEVQDEDAVVVRSSSPTTGVRGDMVEIRGENLDVNRVRFGDSPAIPVQQGPRGETVVVQVPAEISGEQRVRVGEVGDLPFRPLPILGPIETPEAQAPGEPFRIEGRGLHLGMAAEPDWAGVRGGSFERVGTPGECQEGVDCWRITAPEGVRAGTLRARVDGRDTEGAFVLRQRVLDEEGPRVTSSTVGETGEISAASVPITLELSESIEPGARVTAEAGAGDLGPLAQSLKYGDDGVLRLLVEAPVGGWPTGEDVTLRLPTSVRDLAGNGLDQDPETPEAEPYESVFRVAAPAP